MKRGAVAGRLEHLPPASVAARSNVHEATRAGSWLLVASLLLLLFGLVAMGAGWAVQGRLLQAGIGLLILAPVTNVAAVSWALWRGRETLFAAVGVVAVLMLIAGLLIGTV